MEKRAAWEQTWVLQRRQDGRGEDDEGIEVPVPPRYRQADFRSPVSWRHRGKLDVAKERFVSYPGAETEDDPTLPVGWAGWDHLQQHLATHLGVSAKTVSRIAVTLVEQETLAQLSARPIRFRATSHMNGSSAG